MRKNLVVLLVFGLIYNSTLACDLCTIYLGIQPNDFKNSVAVRHRYRLFERDFINNNLLFNNTKSNLRVKGEYKDKHGAEPIGDIAEGETYRYAEAYSSYDVVANFYLSSKFQINTSISFSDNYVYQNDSITNNVGGIGDLNLLLKYQVFNSTKKEDTTNTNKFIHRITLGAGVALPTGNYNKKNVVGFETEFKPNVILGTPIMELDPHLQAGTGSFSYLLLIEYLVKLNSFGINTNASYKINTTNNNEFRFANRFNANGSLFMLAKLTNKVKLMPKIGLSYEYSKRDRFNDLPFIGSGGDILFLNYGLNVFINKVGLEFTYYQPIKEDLIDVQPFNKRRIISQLTYYF